MSRRRSRGAVPGGCSPNAALPCCRSGTEGRYHRRVDSGQSEMRGPARSNWRPDGRSRPMFAKDGFSRSLHQCWQGVRITANRCPVRLRAAGDGRVGATATSRRVGSGCKAIDDGACLFGSADPTMWATSTGPGDKSACGSPVESKLTLKCVAARSGSPCAWTCWNRTRPIEWRTQRPIADRGLPASWHWRFRRHRLFRELMETRRVRSRLPTTSFFSFRRLGRRSGR